MPGFGHYNRHVFARRNVRSALRRRLTLEVLEPRCLLSTRVFYTDFNSGAPPQISGITTTESVQGFAGLGPVGNVFSGKLLHNASGGTTDQPGSVPPSDTTLTVTNLPAHTSIDLRFLFALIDSWDGNGAGDTNKPASPDFFNVQVDGVTKFSVKMGNAYEGDSEYAPPTGVELAHRRDLGFTSGASFYLDSAYNFGRDPRFTNIPHSSSSLRIDWFASGSGWQGGTDESWGIDNLEVLINSDVDLAATQPTWSTTDGGVDFGYAIGGADLPHPPAVALYWASGTTADTTIGGPIATPMATKTAQGSSESFHVTAAQLGTPPQGAKYLLDAVNPPGPNHIPESDETNGNDSNDTAFLQLPSLSPAIDNTVLHKLSYRGQVLSVPLQISNQGGDANGNINIEYYVSTSQDASLGGPGDALLKTDTNMALSVAAGQSVTLPLGHVSIPTFIVKDTYYLKVRVVPAPTIPILSNQDNNIFVSDPLTLYSETNTMMRVARAETYEAAVNTAKDPTHTVDSHTIQDFIKVNEEGSVDHPALRVYPDRGNPAIGFGFDLASNGSLHDGPQVQAILDSFHLLNDSGNRLTVQDLINKAGGIDRDANGRRDDLGLAVANALFDLAFGEIQAPLRSLFPNFDNLSLNVRKALLDLAYNVGIAGIHRFTNLVRNVNAGNFAYAGFDLVDSLRTEQIPPSRTEADFLLLVSGQEDLL